MWIAEAYVTVNSESIETFARGERQTGNNGQEVKKDEIAVKLK